MTHPRKIPAEIPAPAAVSIPAAWDIATRDLLLLPSNPQHALRWLAALGAAGLQARVEPLESQCPWTIRVPAPLSAAALSEIREYEKVNRNWPPPDSAQIHEQDAALPQSPIWPSFLVFIALLLFFLYTGPCGVRNPIARVAAMDAAAFARGEWWRAATALCLHAGVAHVLGNAVCCLFFGHALARRMGYGMAWALIFLSAVAGNMTGAILGARGPISLGASTAVFAAIGLLAAFQFVESWRRRGENLRSIWARGWVALGAGAGLLGLLGTGPGSDLLGHFWGFAWGIVAGGILGIAHFRPAPGLDDPSQPFPPDDPPAPCPQKSQADRGRSDLLIQPLLYILFWLSLFSAWRPALQNLPLVMPH